MTTSSKSELHEVNFDSKTTLFNFSEPNWLFISNSIKYSWKKEKHYYNTDIKTVHAYLQDLIPIQNQLQPEPCPGEWWEQQL